ncbi:MAG: Lrp/AsnC ligand binding domain-containing protein [Candidatus Aenigmatarchaeota archaeon]
MQHSLKKVKAFILASFTYTQKGKLLDQKEILTQIAKFPEVEEAHIISGNWDILIKVAMDSVDEIGSFVVDKLRKVKGIEKTITCMVFQTAKE